MVGPYDPTSREEKERAPDSWLGQTAQMARKNRKGPTGPKHAQLSKERKES